MSGATAGSTVPVDASPRAGIATRRIAKRMASSSNLRMQARGGAPSLRSMRDRLLLQVPARTMIPGALFVVRFASCKNLPTWGASRSATHLGCAETPIPAARRTNEDRTGTLRTNVKPRPALSQLIREARFKSNPLLTCGQPGGWGGGKDLRHGTGCEEWVWAIRRGAYTALGVLERCL